MGVALVLSFKVVSFSNRGKHNKNPGVCADQAFITY
jgi:hypothetical protein